MWRLENNMVELGISFLRPLHVFQRLNSDEQDCTLWFLSILGVFFFSFETKFHYLSYTLMVMGL